MVASSSPATGREPVSVTAAKPAAASTAIPAPGSIRPDPDGRPITAIRVQAARPAGQRLPVTVRKATMSAPPTVSRYAATEIGDSPVARLSRLPVRPPVPHNSPDITR
jgi:hypothetical protein